MSCTSSSCKLASGEVADAIVERRGASSQPLCLSSPSERQAVAIGKGGVSDESSSTTEVESRAPGDTPALFEMVVQRKKGERFGAVLGNTKAGAVVISIEEGGIVDRWNKAFPDNTVLPGFLIEAVNGQTGYWNVMQQMRQSGPLRITISHPPANTSADWFEKIAEMARDMKKQATQESFMVRLQSQGGGSDSTSPSTGGLSSLPCVKASDCGVDQCAICLEDVAPSQTLVQLPCGHAFHPFCAGRWLEQTMKMATNKKQSCPLCCRKVFGTTGGAACCSTER